MKSRYDPIFAKLTPAPRRTFFVDLRDIPAYIEKPMKQAIRRFALRHGMRCSITMQKAKVTGRSLAIYFRPLPKAANSFD